MARLARKIWRSGMPRLLLALAWAGTLLSVPAAAGAGHAAGYRWALAQGIDDPFRCAGQSRAFIEGCREAALATCTAECVDAQRGDEASCEAHCED